MVLKRSSVVCDRALYREALEGANREGHGNLAEKAYCKRDTNEGARAECDAIIMTTPDNSKLWCEVCGG